MNFQTKEQFSQLKDDLASSFDGFMDTNEIGSLHQT